MGRRRARIYLQIKIRILSQDFSRTAASVSSNATTPNQHKQWHQMALHIYGISNEVILEASSNTQILLREGILVGQKAHTVSRRMVLNNEQDCWSISTTSYAKVVTYPEYAESEITDISQSEFFVAELFLRGGKGLGLGSTQRCIQTMTISMLLHHDILYMYQLQ